MTSNAHTAAATLDFLVKKKKNSMKSGHSFALPSGPGSVRLVSVSIHQEAVAGDAVPES